MASSMAWRGCWSRRSEWTTAVAARPVPFGCWSPLHSTSHVDAHSHGETLTRTARLVTAGECVVEEMQRDGSSGRRLPDRHQPPAADCCCCPSPPLHCSRHGRCASRCRRSGGWRCEQLQQADRSAVARSAAHSDGAVDAARGAATAVQCAREPAQQPASGTMLSRRAAQRSRFDAWYTRR